MEKHQNLAFHLALSSQTLLLLNFGPPNMAFAPNSILLYIDLNGILPTQGDTEAVKANFSIVAARVFL